MNVNLTPELERIVNEELRSGHFRSAEEVVARALFVLREKGPTSDRNEFGQAVNDMLEFVRRNRTPLGEISVKELIRDGRRL